MKKFISILLTAVLVASAIVSASAMSLYPDGASLKDTLAAYEAETGEKVDTHRLYFQMPNGQNGPVATEQVSYIPKLVDEEGNETEGDPVIVCEIGEKTPTWYNEFTQGAGVYYWGSAPCATDTWAGYKMEVEDAVHSIFYVDLPITSVCIFNNGVDGGMDASKDIFYKASQTIDVPCEYPDEGEWPGIMTGREEEEGFEGCIFIINPNEVDTSPTSHKMTCGGSWYFYYGDGCYGCYEKDDDRHVCMNPDHYVGGDITGTHAGWQYGTTDPTEPAPTEPEPTDPAPTEPPAPAYKRGDYDKDNKITIMDATRVQNILAKKISDDKAFLLSVDADADGKFTIMDATRIQNYLAKLMNLDGTTPYVG